MSSQASRTRPIRECRCRRLGLSLDLNSAPLSEVPVPVPEPQGIVNHDQSRGRSHQHRQPQVPATIDVDAMNDDDVVLSSPRAFAEARNKALRNRHRRSAVVDVESERTTRSGNHRNRFRRVVPNQSTVNSDLLINLETGTNPKVSSAKSSSPAPTAPTFNCPICFGPLADETTKKCGHIFCKSCIEAAVAAQGKCPTCRKPVVPKDLIRVYLPSTD